MRTGDKGIRGEENFEIVDVKYDDIYKDTFIVMLITSGTHKGKYDIVMESEIDDTYIINK